MPTSNKGKGKGKGKRKGGIEDSDDDSGSHKFYLSKKINAQRIRRISLIFNLLCSTRPLEPQMGSQNQRSKGSDKVFGGGAAKEEGGFGRRV